MAFKPGQSGNPKGSQCSKPWADAIRRAIARDALAGNGDALNAIAEKLIDMAGAGDIHAMHELADRLDGKLGNSLVRLRAGAKQGG